MTISSVAGMIGSYLANPAEVALIRVQADNNLPSNKKRNYKNIFDALFRIGK